MKPTKPQWKRRPPASAPVAELHYRTPNNSPAAARWMWAGVITLSSAILILWGWALKIKVFTINWSQSPEQGLLNTVREEWNSVYSAPEAKRLQAEAEKQRAKETIREIIVSGGLSVNEAVTTSSVEILNSKP